MDIMLFSELRPILPELFICLSAVFLLIVGVISGNRATALLSVAASFVMVMALYMLIINQPHGREVFRDMFVSDLFTSFGKGIVLLGGLLTQIIGNRWLRKEGNARFEYSILILFATLGMMLMISAADLLALYMGLELSSLALYVLAAWDRDNLKSSEAGLKYFVLGSLASGMMLFGMSLVYGFSGSIDFNTIAETILGMMGAQHVSALVSYGLVTGMVLILVGFCFKISAVPFHMWTPDVYEGAPTPVTAFFAIAPKAAAIFLLIRVLEQPFADLKIFWQQIIIFVSLASMIVGALGALTQTNIKRLLAYSSIGHVGFALVGVAAGGLSGTKAVVIYLALYLFMTVGAFGCVLLMQRKGKALEAIDDLSGISKAHPQFAIALALIMFSMAGIPPLAGFFGKMYVFLAAIESGLYLLAVLGVLSSVIACFYYLKIVKVMYFDEGDEAFDAMNTSTRMVVSFCVLVILLFVLQPSLLTMPAQTAAKALYLL